MFRCLFQGKLVTDSAVKLISPSERQSQHQLVIAFDSLLDRHLTKLQGILDEAKQSCAAVSNDDRHLSLKLEPIAPIIEAIRNIAPVGSILPS